jgi:hypothetical protein
LGNDLAAARIALQEMSRATKARPSNIPVQSSV